MTPDLLSQLFRDPDEVMTVTVHQPDPPPAPEEKKAMNITTKLKELFDAMPPELQFLFKALLTPPPAGTRMSLSATGMTFRINGWAVQIADVAANCGAEPDTPPPAEGGAP